MMALQWPSALVPQANMFRIDARSQTGGPTITGDEQIVQSAAGIWRARLSGIACNTPDRIRAYRALLGGLDGRFGTVLVPLCGERPRGPATVATFSPIGTVVTNPLIQEHAITGSNPVGLAVTNPTIEIFWPEVEVDAYKYTAKTPAALGTATIASLQTFTWAPTSGTLAVGDYVTLVGLRRRITGISGTRHAFTPALIDSRVQSSTLTTKAGTGTATIRSRDSYDWGTTGGGVPAIGNYVTLFSVPRYIYAVTGNRHFFAPALSLTKTPGAATTVAFNSAAAQAIGISITVSTGNPIQAGMYFSTAAGRLYLITVLQGNVGTRYDVLFRPPLRTAITAGDPLQMVTPVCEMRLASDDTGELELQMLKTGQATLDFVEA